MGKTKKEKNAAEQAELRCFMDEIEDCASNQILYVGIDPGAEGAVAIVCGKHSYVFDIPTLQEKRGRVRNKKGKMVDKKTTVFDHERIRTLFSIITNSVFFTNGVRQPRAMVERIQPNYGQGSAYAQFRIGCAYAMWPLFLTAIGFRLREEYPVVWKRKMGLFGKSKKRSRKMAKSYFPETWQYRLQREKDHNRAEALLIAEYCRRIFRGGT